MSVSPIALQLLADSGVVLDEAAAERLDALCATVRRFNGLFSLVSQGDLGQLWERHIVDSLALAPYAASHMPKGGLVDIGSGGGFPGLVLAALFPEARVCLVERSDAKVGYLHNARAAMGLEQVEIVGGSFPEAVVLPSDAVVTARAVERGALVTEAVLGCLPMGALFLCQNKAGADATPELFHVEQIQDAWADASLRRGVLFRIARRTTAS